MINAIKKNKGFTLVELFVTLMIVAIITTLSLFLYTDKIKLGRRIDAINALLSISLAEERYRSNNTTYGTLAQVWGGVTTSQEGYYTLSISNVSGTAYTLTAVGSGTQTSDTEDGTSCTTLTLTMSSGTITKAPSACWPI